MFEYTQATALITGASSGIGEAFAYAFLTDKKVGIAPGQAIR
jgi:NADP-dependent 3-hydroxy acid dehydrogenase YdfG